MDKKINDARATYLHAMTTFTKSERRKEIASLTKRLSLVEQKEDKVDRVIQIFTTEMNDEQRQRFIARLKTQKWFAAIASEVAKQVAGDTHQGLAQ